MKFNMPIVSAMCALLFLIVLVSFTTRDETEMKVSEAIALKKSAYDLHSRGKYAESADAFRRYLEWRPSDLQTTFDYAMLLSRLGRHAEAAPLLERLYRLNPGRKTVYFKLGVEYVLLGRHDDAAKVFAELAKSSNSDLAQAATEAGRYLRNDLERRARFEAEQKIYNAARDLKWAEVVEAVQELEKQGPLGFRMEMQLFYALVNLRQYATALERANKLAEQFPKATDLALLRADLLMQLGHKEEALALWQQVKKENSDTEAGRVAESRIAATSSAAASTELPTEETIFDLVGKQRYREAVGAIDQLEQLRGLLSWAMQMQRIYALQALGETKRAVELAEKMSDLQPQSVELALLRADMLVSLHRWENASEVLKNIRASHPHTPVAKEANRRLRALPPMRNLDKWQWGETYMSGEHHSRFNAVVGSGMIRQGTYIPHARWLQPYAVFRFTVDTLSEGERDPQSTVIADNSISLMAGLRLQPFARQYLFFYYEAGLNKDLLARRHRGDWAWDYQAGIYGFKSWGPGVKFLDLSRDTNACAAIWRGSWFADVGADFSYYYRFSSWIGYGQAHEGLRLVQLGRELALDAYAVENIAWDVRGNYFDNLFEIGPGARVVWTPCSKWRVNLCAEWVKGYYMGRDDMNSRGNAASDYEDFRVSLSTGASW